MHRKDPTLETVDYAHAHALAHAHETPITPLILTRKTNMKAQRNKANRKKLHVYRAAFGFREPYQVLADPTFVQAVLRCRLNVEDTVAEALGAPVRLFSTPCLVSELYALGPDLSGALTLCKRLEMRRCHHQRRPDSAKQSQPTADACGSASEASRGLSASDCIRDIIGTKNGCHLIVASQDLRLRGDLRRVPGLPLLYLSAGSKVMIEKTSIATDAAAKKIQRERFGVSQRTPSAGKVVSKNPRNTSSPLSALTNASNVKSKHKSAVKNPIIKKRDAADGDEQDEDLTKAVNIITSL